jgi:hypothetical protein
VPNEGTESQLILNNTLHAPSVRYTLISLGILDEEGYHAHIGDRHLRIVSPQGKQLGRIPCTPHYLYKVTRSHEAANATEIMSAMELHRRLGHIAVASARKLVESGAVTGIELDPDSQERECDACVYTCATCLDIPKPRISKPAEHFGDEVHSDVWGPAPVATRQGRRYFATFTDDATCFTIVYLLRTKDKVLEMYK